MVNSVLWIYFENCPSNRSLNHPCPCARRKSFNFREESSEMEETLRMVGELYHLPSNQIKASRLCSDVHCRTCARQQASNDIFIDHENDPDIHNPRREILISIFATIHNITASFHELLLVKLVYSCACVSLTTPTSCRICQSNSENRHDTRTRDLILLLQHFPLYFQDAAARNVFFPPFLRKEQVIVV